VNKICSIYISQKDAHRHPFSFSANEILKIKTCKIRTLTAETAYHEKCNLQNPENQIKSRKTVEKCLKKRKKADFLNSVIAKISFIDVRKQINRQFERILLSDFNLNFT